MRLTQKVCKPTESKYSSDHGPTCHQGNQTGRGSRATSTLKGLSSKHFTEAEQNDRGTGDPGIMTLSFNIHILFPIQLAVPLVAPLFCTTGGDRLHKFQPVTVSREAITPGHTKLVTDLSKVQPWQSPCDGGNKHPGSSCFSVPSFHSCLEKTSWPTRGCQQKEDSLH